MLFWFPFQKNQSIDDKHFDILKQVNFPKIRILDIESFLSLIKENF